MSSSATQTEYERPFAGSAMILRALAEGVLIVGGDGVLRQANPAAAALLNIPLDALPGLHLGELLGADMLDRCAHESSGDIALGERTLRFSSAPLLPDEGRDQAIGTLITLRDVTAQRAAKHAQYDFVSRALHDVRVPLQAIGGTTEGLLRGWFGPINDEQREFLSSIKENAAHQGDLFSNIFDVYALMAHLVELSSDKVHIEGLIHEIAHEWAARYQARNIELTLSMPEDLPAVLADRRRLRQVLVALFGNACRYTMPGGQAELRASVEAGRLRVDLQDHGVGIRAVDQPKIFTPFFRGESPLREGRYGGLNLAIAKQLIELHGGRMWFESVEGQGSTFSFMLPLPPEPGAA